jgi:YYY domain-containing protein
MVISLGIEAELFAVGRWLLLITFLQLAVWPYLRRAFGSFAFPAAFTVAVLAFTLSSWYCGLARVPLGIALVPFVLLFIYALWKKNYTWAVLSSEWRWEAVFLLFFLFMLEIRFVNPSISYAEKFMDHAFLASIMRTPVVPPLDPWFAGGTLNVYYYLGYWMIGAIGIVTAVPSNIAFNLALPTIFGLAAVNLYILGHLILDRFRWLPLLTILIPNPAFIGGIVQGKTMGSVLWDSTRTIPNTIQEYPIFSFVWGDMHAHVISIANQLFLLVLLVIACRSWTNLKPGSRWLLAFLVALSLGSMPPINTWDVLIYAPVTLLFGFLIWYRNGPAPFRSRVIPDIREGIVRVVRGPRRLMALIAAPFGFLVVVPILAILIYLPFYLQMNTLGVQGVFLVMTPTDIVPFLLIHGFFIGIFLLYLAKDIVRRPWLLVIPVLVAIAGYPAAAIALLPLCYLIARQTFRTAEILAAIGLAVIIFCEFLFLKDNMGDVYYRMNTVFKFYLPAWLLMGTAAFCMLGELISPWIRPGLLGRRAGSIISVVIICLFIATPLLLPLDFPYRDHTLDGLAYLQAAHPGDADAVAYLRSLPGITGVVEAEGGDYTYFSRVSSFTGIPTIIGMPFHEYMWRANVSGAYGDRATDVRIAYQDPGATIPLMRQYGVNHLYVGDQERERYNVSIPVSGLSLVYNKTGVQIYRLGS